MSIQIGKYQPRYNHTKHQWEVVDITTNEVIAHFQGTGMGNESAQAYADKLNGN
jgi:hypothetical protein